MTVDLNTQRIASVVRQVLAVAAVVVGILSAPSVESFLPGYMSAILASLGGIVLAIEHYVSDPSTGTTPAASAVSNKSEAPHV